MSQTQSTSLATLNDKSFFVIWLATLVVVLLIFGSEKYGISVEQSVRERALVNFGSPPLSTYGDSSIVVELSKHGLISAVGLDLFSLEMRNPEPFTRILVDGKLRRRVLHRGSIYQHWDIFFGSDVAYGFLKYVDPSGVRQKIAVQFQYPDYDQSEFDLRFGFRAMVSDEIPASYETVYTVPEAILRGEISDVRIEIPFVAAK